MRVLVVDDSAVIRELIRRTIGLSGLEVSEILEAKDGVEAIQVLALHGADVLITDINMPRMDGVELVRAVRQDRLLAHLPVLVVSTDASTARHEVIAGLRVAGYLSKPFRPEDLRRHLAGVVGGSAVIDQAALDAAIEAAVVEILEVNGFERGERGEPEPAPPAALTARLEFHGPPSGTLQLWIEPAEARALAAALLGTDDLEPALILDAVAELANMVAGHALSRVFGDASISLDHAAVGVELAGPCDLQIIGERGRIGVSIEVVP